MKKQIDFFSIPFPETVDLERQVLADMVVNPHMLVDIIPMIHVDFFTSASRAKIWDTIVDYYAKGMAIDMISISTVTSKDFIDEVVPYIGNAGATVSCLEHVALLRTGATKRRTYLGVTNFLTNAMSPMSSEADIVSSLQTLVSCVEGPAPMQSELKLSQALDAVKEEIKDAEKLKAQGKALRIRTGFLRLDETINGGFKPGQLIILAARPSVGKTAVMLQMAKHAAFTGNAVEIFSLEMTCPELCERLLFSTGKVKPYQISLAEMEWQAFAEAEGELKPLPIYINDFSRALDDIVSRLMQAVMQGRCKIAFIDYLGLIQDTVNPGNTKLYQVIAKITGTLKAVAKRLSIPIVVLCQLNRDQARMNRAPELHDLRDSGSIEQDSDIVIMLEPSEKEGCINAWLRKNRSGKRDIAYVLRPNASYTVFVEKCAMVLSKGPIDELQPIEEDMPF